MSISQERIDNHHCHAKGCKTKVPPEMLMCKDHWGMVPRSIQKRVWAHYRPGQCEDMKVTKDWLKAAQEAIQAVVEAEADEAKLKDKK